MFRFFTCLLLLSIGSLNLTFLNTHTSKADIIDLAPDQFGNLLLVEGEILKKLSPQGKELAFYSNPQFGEPTALSAVDALNPLLFYQESYTLVSLDNRLNESVVLNFLEAGFYDVTLIAQGDEERIWLYDQAQDKLFKYDLIQQKREISSPNITQLSGTENKPIQLISTFNYLYLNVPEKGILRFTVTGAFDQLIPVKKASYIDVNGEILYYLKDHQLHSFHLKTRSTAKLSFQTEVTKPSRIKMKGKQLYVQEGRKIHLYKAD
jgi:hypothetical protein